MPHFQSSLYVVVVFLVALLPAAGLAQPGTPSQQDAEPAADRTNALLRTGYVGGPARAVAVRGAYAYVGLGASLTVLRVDDATHPQRIGYVLLSDLVVAITLDEHTAYVATDDNHLYMIDVTNPTDPGVRGVYISPSPISTLAAANGRVYLGTGSGLRIVDGTHPGRLIELGAISSDWWSIVAIAVAGTFVYAGSNAIANPASSLNILDVSEPREPKSVGVVPFFGSYMSDIAVQGEFAYVGTLTDNGFAFNLGLSILDIANPTAPQRLGSVGASGSGDIAVAGDYAFFTGSIINISDPSKPVRVKSLGDNGRDVAVAGDRVYLARDSFGLTIYDSTSTLPLGTYGAIGSARDVSVGGEYIYVANGDIDAYSSSNSYGKSLRHLSNIGSDTPQVLVSDAGEGVAVSQDRVYGTNGGCFLAGKGVDCTTSLSVFDRMDPAVPAGGWKTSLNYRRGDSSVAPGHITVSGTYAFVAAGIYGMQLVDVADPQSATVLSTYRPEPNSGVKSIAVTGTYALVANAGYGGGLRIVDVADPVHPVEVKSILTSSQILDVAVRGQYAYLAEKNGLVIVDISRPTWPVMVSYLRLRGADDPTVEFPTDILVRIVVDGNYAFVTAGTAGLYLLDISDPTAPVRLDVFDTPGNAVGVAASGKQIYVADDIGGLLVFELGTAQAYLPMIAH